MELLETFVKNSSGVSFLALVFMLFMGVFINSISGNVDKKYIITLVVLILTIIYKVITTQYIGFRYYKHFMELMALPLSLSMIFFSKTIKLNRRSIDYLSWLIIIFQLSNITRFSVLSILLPAYQTTFSLYASLTGFFGVWLLYKQVFKKRAYIIILIAMFCAGISLAKWLLPLVVIYFILIVWFVLNNKSIIFNFLVIVPILLISSVFMWSQKDKFAIINGYDNFDQYYSQRITKEKQQTQVNGEEVFDQVGGIGDGGRFYIWGYHIKGWLNGNITTGVSMSFSNPFHYPEHNFMIFYITRLGIVSILYFLLFISYIINRCNDYKKIKLPYFLLVFFVFVLFSIGGWYGVPLACLFISLLIGLYQNNVVL